MIAIGNLVSSSSKKVCFFMTMTQFLISYFQSLYVLLLILCYWERNARISSKGLISCSHILPISSLLVWECSGLCFFAVLVKIGNVDLITLSWKLWDAVSTAQPSSFRRTRVTRSGDKNTARWGNFRCWQVYKFTRFQNGHFSRKMQDRYLWNIIITSSDSLNTRHYYCWMEPFIAFNVAGNDNTCLGNHINYMEVLYLQTKFWIFGRLS